MSVTQGDRADAIITNLEQLLVLVQIAQTNPTPANIDATVAAINAGTSTGLPVPQPTYSFDGESYDWAGYATVLTDLVLKWVKLRQVLRGPYFQITRMRV